MSLEALTWALNAAPVDDPTSAHVLMALANHAGPDGRNAFPSVDRIAYYTRRSERTIRRHLDKLEAEGLIVAQSDTAVRDASVSRADQRPQVYALQLHLSRASYEAVRRARRDGAKDVTRTASGVSELHPVASDGVQPRHPVEVQRGATVTERGVTVSTTGCHGDTRTIHEPSVTIHPAATDPAEHLLEVVEEGLPQELRDDLTLSAALKECRRLVANGWTPDALAAAMARKSWSGANGAGAVMSWLRGLRPPRGTKKGKPPWCGDCNAQTRQRETTEGAPYRCPACHPQASRAA